MQHLVKFEDLSKFDMSKTETGDTVSVRLDLDQSNTEVAIFGVCEMAGSGQKVLDHLVFYKSPTEFATIAMKQSLTLYVKNRIIELYPETYGCDDAKVNSYVAKLSYEGIKFVANNIEQFAREFHEGKVTMKIPRNRFFDETKNRNNNWGRS